MRLLPIPHDAAHTVRFWVPVNGIPVCAIVDEATLRCCFVPPQPRESALSLVRLHQRELDDIVRRKVADGFLEPVMLHDSDFPIDATVAAYRPGPSHQAS